MSAVSESTISLTWGTTPGAASITLPGDQTSDYTVDTDITVTVGSVSFQGVVTSCTKEAEGVGGWRTVVNAVDNRIWWERQYVYCVFNQPEVREDNLATPGIDRERRYKSIASEDWHTQKWKYNGQLLGGGDPEWVGGGVSDGRPLNAEQVLFYSIVEVGFDWNYEPHEALSQPMARLDANNGMALSQIIGRICEECGLIVTITGGDTIVFARKGEGTLPSVPSGSGMKKSGTALSNAPGKYRIIGERSDYQTNNVTLEPDWNEYWETMVFEWDLLDLIDGLFGPFDADPIADAALAQAKMRSATVREISEELELPNLLDFGVWGEVSRNEIPAYVYVRDIVFKAYRVPPGFEIEPLWLASSLNLDSLTLSDGGLLLNVDYDYDTGEMSVPSSDDRRFFPQQKAFVLAKGFNLDLVDVRGRKFITPEQMAEAQDKWAAVYDFNLDVRPECRSVIFDKQIFTATDLFLFPNNEVDGIDADHPLYGLPVPNAAAGFGPAEVKAALVWKGEKFSQNYGSGSREGVMYVSGLQEQWVMDDAGVLGLEVPAGRDDGGDPVYADGLADEYVENLILRNTTFASGGYRRYGAAGTALNGKIERVTISVKMGSGLTEEVEFSNDKAPATVFPQRFLEWNRQFRDLFPGQEDNKRSVFELQTIASLKALKRVPQTERLKAIPDLMQRPMGAAEPAPVIIQLAGSESAGSVIFQNAAGDADADGKVFGGVVVVQGAEGAVPCATAGTVPVRVKGPFTSGSTVGVRDGEKFARIMPEGHKAIGRVLNDYSGDAEVLAYVALGGGAGHSALKPSKLNPWNVYVTSITESEGVATAVKVKLNPDSTFLKSAKLGDIQDFSEEFDTIYELDYGECLWMELNFGSDGAFSTVQIKNGVPASEGWTDFATDKSLYEFLGDYPDDKTQTAWVMLASIDEAAENDPVVATFASGAATLRNYWRGGDMMLARFCVLPADGGEKIGYVKPFLRGYQGIL